MSVSSGCQLQVSLRGAQDILLMSPQEDTFFRVEYRRHSNFASGENEQSCNTTPALGRRNIQTTISRSGDLLSQVYLNARFTPFTVGATDQDFSSAHCAGYVNGLGYAMIDEIVCLVGNKDFDRQDGEFMFMREQVAHKADRKLGRAAHCFDSSFAAAQQSLHPVELNVPLQFWFCNYIEQSLPVIGLYWHEVQLNLSLKSLADLTYSVGTTTAITAGNLESLQYICNFQYLDRPERALFANDKLEQVYVQHQTLGEESWTADAATKEVNIRFNHPITDLMWSPRLLTRTSTVAKEWFNYNGKDYAAPGLGLYGPILQAETFRSAQIFFNNQQRTIDLSAEYLRQIPQLRSQEAISADDEFRVYGYCFGVKVNDLLHTGSANFSRFDQATIRFTLWGPGLQTFAVASDTARASSISAANIALGAACSVRVHARNFQLNKTSIGSMLPFPLSYLLFPSSTNQNCHSSSDRSIPFQYLSFSDGQCVIPLPIPFLHKTNHLFSFSQSSSRRKVLQCRWGED